MTLTDHDKPKGPRMDFKRYAIYATPAPGPLADFGAAWLGWDCAAGCAVDHPHVSGLPMPLAEITDAPRKYGLHATMKPPFRLTEGQNEAALKAAFERFCSTTAPVTLDALTLARLGRFLALVPLGDQTALNALAAKTVKAFEPFRAPLTESELTHRRAAGLSPEQDALLLKWGYPYVIEAFRFHITLTGKLPRAQAVETHTILARLIEPLLPRPFPISSLALMGEDGLGRFHLIHRRALSG
ncbi:putative phosphonate metabolism protein [Roseovarius lutimaris]|uniref:Putative phosphonate metabolism protein n=2 Tax=Roseovarius lutimaris TaxID=1005928 RepID=A0A1I5FKC5_9RHOB|nr:putative phosphonate metabolism protein [Roseovarius lutimaris]